MMKAEKEEKRDGEHDYNEIWINSEASYLYAKCCLGLKSGVATVMSRAKARTRVIIAYV